ncbi:MAG: hypothetical protein IRY83_16255, partial [Chloroflexi bacterium]|nr:hypothetical protein [Chloroflexota bacterium]
CRTTPTALARLAHPFRILVFDWDGTAVAHRAEDATPVRQRIDLLLRRGVFIAVISGTSVRNIDHQLSAAIAGPHKQRLYLCTNRGSEVYGFDAHSHLILLWRRIATPTENRLLTAAANAVQQAIQARTGLSIRVISNRLNRRKIDLIPEPAWANPPKSAIGPLLTAVERRLRSAGLAGGLNEALTLAVRAARELGLCDARITSDVKHIEIGLTDKGDSVAWVMEHLAAPHRIPPSDVLLAGDELGPTAGFPGSDARMMIPAARGAVVISVGPEPGGTPPGVIHLGGGPSCFRAVLDLQIAAHPAAGAAPDPPVPNSPPEPDWLLVEEHDTPAREHEIESLFALANGYVGTRGTVQEHTILAEPGTYLAGVYTRSAAESAGSELISLPDWAEVRVFVNGTELRSDLVTTLEHRRVLDLHRGLFCHAWRVRDPSGRITRLEVRRFLSLADRHALVETIHLTPENYGGSAAVACLVDASLANTPVILRTAAETADGPAVTAVQKTDAITVALAEGSCFRGPGPAHRRISRDHQAGERWEWQAILGTTYRIDKLAAIFTTRETADPFAQATAHWRSLAARGADALLAEHTRTWARAWQDAEVAAAADDGTRRALRFAVFHLIASANPADEHTSIGARGLTGPAYKGHVFWDTEIYLLPFYLLTWPAAARALLAYRYHTLPAARRKAAALGFRGAFYAWESTDTGTDVTPTEVAMPDGEVVPLETGTREVHISADVAYAVWQYWQATGDARFLLDMGAEILIETARFWVSRAVRGDNGRLHLCGVIGPDEYHTGVDDDAYTNGMARWNLARAADAVELIRTRWPEHFAALAERLQLEADEPTAWRTAGQAIVLPCDPSSGLIEQFRGYFACEDIDPSAYAARTGPIELILGRERLARSQIIKQPDVLLLIYLLWNEFPPAVRRANFQYYAPRCAHGSSLSPSIHALLAARLGDLDLARRYFRQAAEIDLANTMGNAAGGIHLGALGGLWQAAVLGFGGLRIGPRGLAFEPQVPEHWQSLSYSLYWRGRHLRVRASARPRSLEIELRSGSPLTVELGEENAVSARITPGRTVRGEASNSTWQEVR